MLCSNVLHNLSWDVSGTVIPCNNLQKFPGSLSVDEMYNSTAYQELLNDHTNGKKSPYCQHCWDKESIQLNSKRITDNKVGTIYEKINPKYLKIDAAIGDVCNAACRTCGPSNSTLWQTEKSIIPIRLEVNETVWKVIDNRLEDVLQLDFGGGEPWLNEIEQQIKVCQELIDKDLAKQVKLRYNTNCSLYPKKLIDLFPYFRSVELTLSIDDTHDRFEYNRYPLKWDKVQRNIHQLLELEQAHKNVVLTVNFTVSVLSFMYADAFLKWCHTQGLPKVNWNFVYKPRVYSIMAISPEIKEKLSTDSLFYDLVATDNYESWHKDFLALTAEVDSRRNQSIETVLPELYALLT